MVSKLLKRVAAVGVLVVVGFGAWVFFGFDHTIVNGAEIYARVSAIRSAVPKRATDVRVRSSSASWIGGCSQIPGSRSGWTSDYVSVGFVDEDSRASVQGQISHALVDEGWLRDDESPGAHRGPIAHWTLDVRSAHLVQAWAFPVGPGGHHWFFSANWSPPGPKGQGCP
jgi:hypothetical protein